MKIVELRQYTLKPGMRDTLIELFDREFVETQEAAGMDVIGQFRDLDDPDRFVWLRGFADMEARAASLAAFYDGPVWKAHREAANATMVDSDNVLLLRPARTGSGFHMEGIGRPPPGATALPAGVLTVVILYLSTHADEEMIGCFDRDVAQALARDGATVLASFVTESAANSFPRLPVREGDNVFVLLAPDAARAALNPWPRSLESRFLCAPEILRLAPTARSRLRV